MEIPTTEFVKSIKFTPELYGVGVYEIDWRAISKDGHVIKGNFSFYVKSE